MTGAALAATSSSVANGPRIGRSVVFGARGQVGGALLERLGEGPVTGTARTPAEGFLSCDFERIPSDGIDLARLVGETRAETVLIAAAFTNVDECERQPARAFAINRDAPAAIAAAARRFGARTVFFSTEYVFDGRDGPYSETDRPNPTSTYGRSKREGEEAVVSADPDALVVRTTVVWGPEANGKNFAYQLAAKLTAGIPMAVPVDQISTPTWNRDLADATVRLVEAGVSGLVHVVGSERMGRAAFALRLAAALGLDERLIEPRPTSGLGQAAVRPLDAGLLTDRLRRLLPDFRPRTVEEGVADWLAHPKGRRWPS